MIRGTRTQIIKSHHFFPCRMRCTITPQLFRGSVSSNTTVQQADLLPSPWKRHAPSLWRLASVTRQSRLAHRITRLPPAAPRPPPLAARLAQTAARLPRMRALASLRIMSFFLSAYEGVSSMRCAGKNKDTRGCDLPLLPVGTTIKCMCLVCLEAFSTSVGTACMHEAAGINARHISNINITINSAVLGRIDVSSMLCCPRSVQGQPRNPEPQNHVP